MDLRLYTNHLHHWPRRYSAQILPTRCEFRKINVHTIRPESYSVREVTNFVENYASNENDVHISLLLLPLEPLSLAVLSLRLPRIAVFHQGLMKQKKTLGLVNSFQYVVRIFPFTIHVAFNFVRNILSQSLLEWNRWSIQHKDTHPYLGEGDKLSHKGVRGEWRSISHSKEMAHQRLETQAHLHLASVQVALCS